MHWPPETVILSRRKIEKSHRRRPERPIRSHDSFS
jgi:hypothetical protein